MTVKSTYISAPLTRYGRKTRKTGVFGVLLNALSIRSERKRLSELDDHMLQDIGVSRDDADTEARRPVWDAPSRWFL